MADAASVIRDNLRRVRDRIAEAATKAGRLPDEVRLVGVTKYVGPTEARMLVDAGCRDLGESRPQELWRKADSVELAGADIQWHQIGHMQRNKVAKTVPRLALLHSVDSYRTLAGINKVAEQGGFVADVLYEVNCSGDREKHGCLPAQLPQDIEELDFFRHVHVRGLMTMASRDGDREQARRDFAKLRILRDQAAPLAPPGTQLTELSMGMSGDFEEAIAEGATIIRVGSALWEGVTG